ncbi:hypothetical protein [Streptomyces sp. NPDC055134]
MRGPAASVAGAAFAAIMNRLLVEVHGARIAAETAYITVWASCGTLALLGLAIARRVGRAQSLAVRAPAAETAVATAE